MESVTPMIGLLVMAYGGPNNIEEVEPYLLDVRGHRPTSPEIVHEVRERYREIGGRSPILEQTQAQALALEAALNVSGPDFKAFVGMRHWHPYIKDTLVEMQALGVQRLVGLVMAPHYSRMSIEVYFQKIEEAGSSIQVAPIKAWYLLPGYLDALVSRVRIALERFPANLRSQIPVIFSAHSLPERILESHDPYPDQLRETVDALLQRLDGQPHAFAYQSAAISKEPWLGPDVSALIKRFAEEGRKNIISCPIGFTCEHVEVLYDIDIVYQKLAKSLGVRLERIEMVGAAPEMITGLAELIRSTAREANWIS
jgi:protoporphyrin/coproporphyrin ferrochelatase